MDAFGSDSFGAGKLAALCKAALPGILLLLTGCLAGETPPTTTAARSGPAEPAKDDPLAAYSELMQEGLRYNALNRHEDAERAFRKALSLRETHFGQDDPGAGNAMIHMAIEISRQGRFDEADFAFERSEPIMRISASQLDHPRWQTYRAIDLLNRKAYEESFQLVARANLRREEILQIETAKAQASGLTPGSGLETARGDQALGKLVEATAHYRMGDFARAKAVASEARELTGRMRTAPRWWRARIDDLIGLVEAQLERYRPAEERVSRAAVTKPAGDGQDPSERGIADDVGPRVSARGSPRRCARAYARRH